MRNQNVRAKGKRKAATGKRPPIRRAGYENIPGKSRDSPKKELSRQKDPKRTPAVPELEETGKMKESAQAVRERKMRNRNQYHEKEPVKKTRLQFDSMESDGSLKRNPGETGSKETESEKQKQEKKRAARKKRLEKAERKAVLQEEKLERIQRGH